MANETMERERLTFATLLGPIRGIRVCMLREERGSQYLPFMILTYPSRPARSPGSASEPCLLADLATHRAERVHRAPVAAGLTASSWTAAAPAPSASTFYGPALALGILAQLVPVPFARGREAMRLAAWTAGWLAWLLAGPASLLHALS